MLLLLKIKTSDFLPLVNSTSKQKKPTNTTIEPIKLLDKNHISNYQYYITFEKRFHHLFAKKYNFLIYKKMLRTKLVFSIFNLIYNTFFVIQIKCIRNFYQIFI